MVRVFFCNLRLRYCRFAGFVCLQLWGRGYSLRCYGEFVCSDLAGKFRQAYRGLMQKSRSVAYDFCDELWNA